MSIKVSVWLMFGLTILFLVMGVKNIMVSDIIGVVDVILAISLALTTALGLKEGKENEQR